RFAVVGLLAGLAVAFLAVAMSHVPSVELERRSITRGGRDYAYGGSPTTARTRAAISASLKPSTSNRLVRAAAPPTKRTARGCTPSAAASSRSTTALAAPSTGGALTASLGSSPNQPDHLVTRAPGCTRTCTRAI